MRKEPSEHEDRNDHRQDLFGSDGQRVDPHTAGVIDGAGDGGRLRIGDHLAHALGAEGAIGIIVLEELDLAVLGHILKGGDDIVGEVVFTTGMVNYQETFTDPSHYGQIVLQTFPLVGNAGINDEDYDTSKSYISGYIVREWFDSLQRRYLHGKENHHHQP